MSKLARLATTGGAQPVYVDDVFSTYLYTGNGSTQTINNGIDLAGEGGLVWFKSRSAATNHTLYDTDRGVGNFLETNTAAAQAVGGGITAFNNNGFTFASQAAINTNAATYTSWTFRKAPKFFDVVTYTGDSVAGRQIPHSLGVAPGMIIVKCTSQSGTDWSVWHRSTANAFLYLNGTSASATDNGLFWGNGVSYVAPTSTGFTVSGNVGVNGTGNSYVAYLFAHDTDTTDGMIQCGSYVADGTSTQAINLGWEPQFIIRKRSDGISNWDMFDVMRGAVNASTSSRRLQANDFAAEDGSTFIYPVATGFIHNTIGTDGYNYIYLAIRRPNKPPTSGTEVFNISTYSGNGSAGVSRSVVTNPFDADVFWHRTRNFTVNPASNDSGVLTRLLGLPTISDLADGSITNQPPKLDTYVTDAQSIFNGIDNVANRQLFVQGNNGATNLSGWNYVVHSFRRAPGFFDVVCYTGTGLPTTVNHNLGVPPELIITKGRSQADGWFTYAASLGAGKFLQLQQTNAASDSTTVWNNTTPNSTSFQQNVTAEVTKVAYLFASLPGISKVGSYTGNGTNQTINCGFTTGARFVLIKRTDSTGDWYVWDTARGIVAANDPHLSLNSTAAEVTTNDSVDPDNSGFIVNQNTTTNINVSSATYIFLAIA